MCNLKNGSQSRFIAKAIQQAIHEASKFRTSLLQENILVNTQAIHITDNLILKLCDKDTAGKSYDLSRRSI